MLLATHHSAMSSSIGITTGKAKKKKKEKKREQLEVEMRFGNIDGARDGKSYRYVVGQVVGQVTARTHPIRRNRRLSGVTWVETGQTRERGQTRS